MGYYNEIYNIPYSFDNTSYSATWNIYEAHTTYPVGTEPPPPVAEKSTPSKPPGEAWLNNELQSVMSVGRAELL